MSKQQFSRHDEASQSSNQIPADLLIDIFTRLPAESIARFRCVSKFWESYILRRSDFTELFLTKSCTRPRLFFALEVDDKLYFYSTHQPRNNPDDNSSLVATPYYKSFPKYVPSYTITPVCGLVLLQGCNKRKVRVICNPATGEFLTLPKVLLREKNVLAKDRDVRDKIARMYLGYDPIGKQFKVLCMTTTSSRYDVRDNTHQVLTLGPGKRFWRPIERKFHFERSYIISREICINGVLYFGAGKCGCLSTIVCFNVGSERFSFINIDKDMRHCNFGGSLTLFNYKDRLGIHRREERFQNDGIVFWVLEDAENHKWSKHIYVLSPLEEDMIAHTMFVGMTGTGELVWSSSYYKTPNSFYLIFYNLESETLTKVNIQGFEEFMHQYRLIKTCVEYVENVKFVSDKWPTPLMSSRERLGLPLQQPKSQSKGATSPPLIKSRREKAHTNRTVSSPGQMLLKNRFELLSDEDC